MKALVAHRKQNYLELNIMRDELFRVHSVVLDQQKFAETKNAVLATLSAASLTLLWTAFSTKIDTMSYGNSLLLFSAIVSYLLSLFLNLYSFVPVLSNSVTGETTASRERNLIFFEDLKEMSESQLLEKFELDKNDPAYIDKCIANQVIVHSKITSRKHWLFSISVVFFQIGIALLAITFFSVEIVPKFCL